MEVKKSVLIPGGGFHAFWFGFGCGSGVVSKGKVDKLFGYSAGAMSAVLSALNVPIEDVVRVATSLIDSCRIGALDNVVKSMMSQLIPNDAHEKLKDVVHIIVCSCANWFMGEVISEWESTDSLIECVVASCFIPGIVSFSLKDPVYGAIDGTFCRNLSSICDGLYEIPSPSPGLCERFQVISEEEARELFELGAQASVAV